MSKRPVNTARKRRASQLHRKRSTKVDVADNAASEPAAAAGAAAVSAAAAAAAAMGARAGGHGAAAATSGVATESTDNAASERATGARAGGGGGGGAAAADVDGAAGCVPSIPVSCLRRGSMKQRVRRSRRCAFRTCKTSPDKRGHSPKTLGELRHMAQPFVIDESTLRGRDDTEPVCRECIIKLLTAAGKKPAKHPATKPTKEPANELTKEPTKEPAKKRAKIADSDRGQGPAPVSSGATAAGGRPSAAPASAAAAVADAFGVPLPKGPDQVDPDAPRAAAAAPPAAASPTAASPTVAVPPVAAQNTVAQSATAPSSSRNASAHAARTPKSTAASASAARPTCAPAPVNKCHTKSRGGVISELAAPPPPPPANSVPSVAPTRLVGAAVALRGGQTPTSAPLQAPCWDKAAGSTTLRRVNREQASVRAAAYCDELNAATKAREHESEQRLALAQTMRPAFRRSVEGLTPAELVKQFACIAPNSDKSLQQQLRRAMADYHPDRADAKTPARADRAKNDLVYELLHEELQKLR